MVMLSELLRFRLAEGSERHTRLVDLVVDVAASDYPPVESLVVARDGELATLPWAAARPDWRRRRIAVDDLGAAKPATTATLESSVLLKRDTLDAMVIDLANRQVTLANDLWLRQEDGALRLRAADVGSWAVLRRLGRGWLGRGGREDRAMRRLLDWKNVEFLRGDPRAAQSGRDYHRRIVRLQPGEIARLLDALPYLHAAELLTLIPDPPAADTLEAMSTERQLQVFEELDGDQATRLLALMAPEAATDLLGRLTPQDAQRHLERLPAERRQRLLDLLRYPEDTAGGIMTNALVLAPADLTVGQAKHILRAQLAEPDFVYYVYVVDSLEARHLQGVLTLRELVLADEAARLGAIMRPHLDAADPLEPAAAVARRVADNNLAALPVVARDGRLLGAVTADAAVAQIVPATWREQAPRVFS